MATRQRPAGHRERGASISTFVAAVMVPLMLVMGLVIDGGAQASARARAHAVAAEAARAGADAHAAASVTSGDPAQAAARAAQVVLDRHQVSGTVTVARQVTVNTTITIDTVFVSLIGVRTLTARSSVSADVLPN